MSKAEPYKPLSMGVIRKFWGGVDKSASLSDVTQFVNKAYVAGLAEGRRLERMDLNRSFRRQPESHRDCILGDWFKSSLATRAKKVKK